METISITGNWSIIPNDGQAHNMDGGDNLIIIQHKEETIYLAVDRRNMLD